MTVGFDALRDAFADEIESRLTKLAPDGSLLSVATRYHLATGGKRLRAYMPMWVCAQLGGDAEDAISLGVGFEALHNATLVHDDLQDGDRMRRGADAVWTRYGAPQAINVGNALFFLGFNEVGAAPCASDVLLATSEAMLAIVAGQALEFQLQLPRGHAHYVAPTIDCWAEMARGKTAALFELCVYAGAVAAGREASDAEALSGFGATLGMLFQLQDDYLDLVGDKGRDQPATDIAEGKISYPVAWALEHADARPRKELETIIGTPRTSTDPQMVQRALEILRETGALAATADRIRLAADESRQGILGQAAGVLIDRILAPIRHAL